MRARLFIGEKSNRTNPDGLRAQLETSLQRLGCDSFDLYQAHGVTDMAELDRRSPAIEAILRARDEGLTRFVGITGHDFGTAAAQLAAVRRFDLDSVMLPVYPGALVNAQYAADLAARLAEAARRDLAVRAIKAGAHQPWGTREKTSTTWYEPFTDPESVARGVRFTLGTPGVHAFCTTGDVDVLPMQLAAAASYEPLSVGEREALLTDAAEWPTIFPLTEHAADASGGRRWFASDGAGRLQPAASNMAATRSAIITVGRWVLARGTVGITDASHTSKPS